MAHQLLCPWNFPDKNTGVGCCFLLQVQFSSVQFRRSVLSGSLRPHEPQHARPRCPSPAPGVHPNPCPSRWWCHPTISSSVVLFFSCPQSFPGSGSFQMSQLFASDGQSIGVSASASVLSMNTQDWSPLGWAGWISFQSKGPSRVFSTTTVQKHQFFGAQLLQGIFLIQRSNPSLLHWQADSLPLSYRGSPQLRPNCNQVMSSHFGHLIYFLFYRAASNLYEDPKVSVLWPLEFVTSAVLSCH